jgi:hypothetical protein
MFPLKMALKTVFKPLEGTNELEQMFIRDRKQEVKNVTLSYINKTKSVAFSPQANYTDRVAAAGR